MQYLILPLNDLVYAQISLSPIFQKTNKHPLNKSKETYLTSDYSLTLNPQNKQT